MFGKGKHNRRVSKRLLLVAGSAAGVAAASVFAATAAFGLFNSTTATQTNTFSAGTVTLTSDTSGACNVSGMLPGTSPTPCTLKATYSGNVSAYLGLDVLIETQHVSGGTNLYSAGPNDLQVAISSTTPTVPSYTVPTATTTCPLSAPGGSTCYELDNELVATTAFTSSSPSVTFTTTVSLPTSSGTGDQGGAAQIILTAHAVQSGNNSETGCSAGSPCTTVHWR